MKNNTRDEWAEDLNELKEQFKSIPTGISAMGWNILIPLVPLIGLVILVLTHI